MKKYKDIIGYEIKCKTREECDNVLRTLDKLGAKWNDSMLLLDYRPSVPCNLYTDPNGIMFARITYVSEHDYRKITAEEFIKEVTENRNIVIYQNDNSVFAVEKINGKVARTAEARCCPGDTFNFDVGAELAFERLIGELPPLKEPMKIVKQKKYKVGDKVKIRKWEDMKKEYGVNSSGSILCEARFVSGMGKYCGKILEISEVKADGTYRMKTGTWNFSSDMFEGKLV